MHLTQFLTLEVCRDCNLACQHPACPSNDPRRFRDLPQPQELTKDIIVAIIDRMYQHHGFRGMVAFHYYNEPLLAKDTLFAVIAESRIRVPASRFLLWTNGTLITPANAQELLRFDRVYVTNYDNSDYSYLNKIHPDVTISPARFDRRLQLGTQVRYDRCVRPFTEFNIDYYGNVHICCADWVGAASPGNIFIHPLPTLITKFQKIREQLSGATMTADAPAACLTCDFRLNEIASFLPEINAAARARVGM